MYTAKEIVQKTEEKVVSRATKAWALHKLSTMRELWELRYPVVSL